MKYIRCLYHNLKFFYLNIFTGVKRYKKVRSLSLKDRDIVLFYLPPCEVVSGGILSIYFLIENTQRLFPDFIVLPVVMSRIQHYFKATWFKNNYFIYNILDIKSKLFTAKTILVHIPEDFFLSFSKDIEKYFSSDQVSKLKINILNQNQMLAPSGDEILTHKHKYASLSMTLAFEKNMSNSYPYLDTPPYLLSSWFYGNEVELIPYEQKENVCIISHDTHPMKKQIVDVIENKIGLECIEIRNMKFDDFKALQRKAKWSVTFGEGFDGYSGAAYIKGGIGFGVYDPNFFPDSMKKELPKSFFISYEDMLENICDVITYMDEKSRYEEFVKRMQAIVLSYNSPEFVSRNLYQ